MKTALLLAVTLGAGFVRHLAADREQNETRYHLRLAQKELERFENPCVFTHAQYVARITNTPLYQVLTGKLLIEGDAYHEK